MNLRETVELILSPQALGRLLYAKTSEKLDQVDDKLSHPDLDRQIEEARRKLYQRAGNGQRPRKPA